MNIKFKVGKFLEALAIVDMAIDKKGHLETQDVLLSASKEGENSWLYLFGTDFMHQSIAKIDITIIEPGDLPFNPKELYTALSNRDAEAEANIISNDKQSVIKVGKSKFKLNTSKKLTLLKHLKDAPLEEDGLITIDPVSLVDIFKRTKACVSTDVNNTNRYIMRGIHLKSVENGYVAETTDGFSASSVNVFQKDLPDFDLIIPGEFTSILLKIAQKASKAKTNINIIRKNNFIFFKLKDAIVGTTIMQGKFPNISTIIDSNKDSQTKQVDFSTFKSAIDRILGFENFHLKSTSNVILQVKDNILTIKAPSQDDCEEIIEFEPEENNDVEDLRLKVSGTKLLEIISTNSAGKLSICFPKTDKHPFSIKEELPDKLTAFYVMMPIRL